MAKYHQPAKLASPFSNRNGRAGRASSSRTWPHHDSGPCCQVPSAARNSSTNRVSAASAAAAAAPATSRPSHQKDHERANSIGKISKRVALNGNGPTYVSRDTQVPRALSLFEALVSVGGAHVSASASLGIAHPATGPARRSSGTVIRIDLTDGSERLYISSSNGCVRRCEATDSRFIPRGDQHGNPQGP